MTDAPGWSAGFERTAVPIARGCEDLPKTAAPARLSFAGNTPTADQLGFRLSDHLLW